MFGKDLYFLERPFNAFRTFIKRRFILERCLAKRKDDLKPHERDEEAEG